MRSFPLKKLMLITALAVVFLSVVIAVILMLDPSGMLDFFPALGFSLLISLPLLLISETLLVWVKELIAYKNGSSRKRFVLFSVSSPLLVSVCVLFAISLRLSLLDVLLLPMTVLFAVAAVLSICAMRI